VQLKDQFSAIHQSTISAAERCKRFFFYRYRWGLYPKIEQFAPSATLGSLFHRLLQLGPESVEKVRSEVKRQQMGLMERINKGEDLIGELARTAQNLTELFNKALVMATIFWKNYPTPDYLATVGTEQTLQIKNIERKELGFDLIFPLRGRIDKIVKDTREEGKIWIRDIKSTGRGLEAITTGYNFSIQARLYRVLVASMFPDDKVAGIILDIAIKPGIKFCGKDKSFDGYLKRVEKWYEEKGKDAMTSKAIMFNEPLYPCEFQDAVMKITHLAELPLNPDAFGKDITGSYCYHYDKKCPYYDLCNSCVEAWPNIINQMFQVVERKEETESEVETE